MPDYENGKIYTIRCKLDNTHIYVGSTTQLLSKRMVEHRSGQKNPNSQKYNRPLYVKMRELGVDNFYIELYEDFPCDRKEQLEKREGEIIRLIGTLNSSVAGLESRKNATQYNKEYYQTNKQKILDKYNKIFVCECGCQLRYNELSRHKKTQKHIKLIESLAIKD